MKSGTLKLNGVSKRFGGRVVLNRVSFVVNAGETVGLVGPNGSGKTTLLDIVAGRQRPDSGVVRITPGLRPGLLPQGYASLLERFVGEAFPALFTAAEGTDELARLGAQLAGTTDPAAVRALEERYQHALSRIEARPPSSDVERLWAELHLRAVAPDEPVARLSGGELAKLGLLSLIASGPDALLLDEPTNNLDLGGLDWLERYLASFPGPVLIVSHDRALLDARASAIVELDPSSGAAEMFAGNYSEYADEKARREAELWERYRRQEREQRRVRRVISATESRARGIEQRTIDFHYRKRALKVARRATTLKARLERQLHSAEHVDRPGKKPHGVRGQFQVGDRGASRLVSAQGVTLEIGGRRLLENVDFDIGRRDRVFLIGPNGTGKTTLLRAILGDHAVTAGRLRVGPSVSLGYLPQEEPQAAPGDGEADVTPIDLVRTARPISESEANNFLHNFLFSRDQVLTPVSRLSYGERRRLALARFVLEGANLLLLDEPTNHLDVPSREAFESALGDFEGAAFIVTHDRYFIDRFADVLLSIEHGRVVRL